MGWNTTLFDSSGLVKDARLTAPSQAWSYIGIPYPTDALPGLSTNSSTIPIMPTLPDGAYYTAHDWYSGNSGSYDPCLIETPSWPGDGALNYYCKYNGNDGTAGNGGRGNPTNPRLTLPTGPFSAGTKIFLEGDNTPLPTSRTTNRKEDFSNWLETTQTFNSAGTYTGTDDICWIIGINKPRLGVQAPFGFTDTNHLIIDGVICDRANPTAKVGSIRLFTSNYITFRNGAQYGPYVEWGASEFRINTSKFVMYYNNEMAYCGQYDVPGGNDYHGFRPEYNNQYLWLIGNHIHSLNGDSMQVGNSSNTLSVDQTTHYVFCAGNESHGNQENSFDFKNSFHCIVSENEVYDHTGADAGGANATGIIIAQDNEGPHSAYHWALANRIHDCYTGVRCSGDSSTPDKTFVIGNVVYDCLTGLNEGHGGPGAAGTETYYINNTVVNCSSNGLNINVYQPANPMSVYVRRNLFYECGTPEITVTGDNGLDYLDLTDNWAYSAAGGESFSPEFTPDVNTGNTLGTNPLLNAPGSNDFSLTASSPCKDSTTEDAVYQAFTDLYGLNIEEDLAGVARPQGSGWSIGAYEE